MLVVVFGGMKFYHYLYGWEFTCPNDHKSLGDIPLKHLSDAPSRLKNLLLKIQPLDSVIKYVLGFQGIKGWCPQWSQTTWDGWIQRLRDVSMHELTPCLTSVHVEKIQMATQGHKTPQLPIQQTMGWFACTLQESTHDTEAFLATMSLY